MDSLPTLLAGFIYGAVAVHWMLKKRYKLTPKVVDAPNGGICRAMVPQLRDVYLQLSIILRAVLLHSTLAKFDELSTSQASARTNQLRAVAMMFGLSVQGAICSVGLLWPLLDEVSFSQYHEVFHDLALFSSRGIVTGHIFIVGPQMMPARELLLHALLIVVHQATVHAALVQLSFINLSQLILQLGHVVLLSEQDDRMLLTMAQTAGQMLIVSGFAVWLRLFVLHGERAQLRCLEIAVSPLWVILWDFMGDLGIYISTKAQQLCPWVTPHIRQKPSAKMEFKWDLPGHLTRGLCSNVLVACAGLNYSGQTLHLVRSGQATWASRWASVVGPFTTCILVIILNLSCLVKQDVYVRNQDLLNHLSMIGLLASSSSHTMVEGPEHDVPEALIFFTVIHFSVSVFQTNLSDPQAWKVLTMKLTLVTCVLCSICIRWEWWEGQPGWSVSPLVQFQVIAGGTIILAQLWWSMLLRQGSLRKLAVVRHTKALCRAFCTHGSSALERMKWVYEPFIPAELRTLLWSSRAQAEKILIAVALGRNFWSCSLSLAGVGFLCNTPSRAAVNLLLSAVKTVIWLRVLWVLVKYATPRASERTIRKAATLYLLYVPGTFRRLMNFHAPSITLDCAITATLAATFGADALQHHLLYTAQILASCGAVWNHGKAWSFSSKPPYSWPQLVQQILASTAAYHIGRHFCSNLTWGTATRTSSVEQPVGNGGYEKVYWNDVHLLSRTFSADKRDNESIIDSMNSICSPLSVCNEEDEDDIVDDVPVLQAPPPAAMRNFRTAKNSILQKHQSLLRRFQPMPDIQSDFNVNQLLTTWSGLSWWQENVAPGATQLFVISSLEVVYCMMTFDEQAVQEEAVSFAASALFATLAFAQRNIPVLVLLGLLGCSWLLLPQLVAASTANMKRFNQLAWFKQQEGALMTANLEATSMAEQATSLWKLMQPVLKVAESAYEAHSVYLLLLGQPGCTSVLQGAPGEDGKQGADDVLLEPIAVCETPHLTLSGSEATQQLQELVHLIHSLGESAHTGRQLLNFALQPLPEKPEDEKWCNHAVSILHTSFVDLWSAKVWVCCPLQLPSHRLGTLLVLGQDSISINTFFCNFTRDMSQQLTNLMHLSKTMQDIQASNNLLHDILPADVARRLKTKRLKTGGSGRAFQLVRNSSSVRSRMTMTSECASPGSITSFEEVPSPISQSEDAGEVVWQQWHGNVSVLFADIVGYTSMSQELEPPQVMEMLHHLFSKYDNLCGKWGVYKVETIGDCYMACTGLIQESPSHAADLVMFAKDMLAASGSTVSPQGGFVNIRVGINSGRVMSGVVGTIRPRYCLFGDTVNTASRMESTGVPKCIQVSATTHDLLPPTLQAKFVCRGPTQVKGKGDMLTYLCSPHTPSIAHDAVGG